VSAPCVYERMPKMNNSPKNASILFGTYSTGFRHFITKICILLFVQNLASKSVQLLISNYSLETNRIQREFLFNNGIPSQEFLSASKPPRQKTNFFKQSLAVKSPLSIVSLRTLWGGGGGGDCAADLSPLLCFSAAMLLSFAFS
jgi:hypothetical protein